MTVRATADGVTIEILVQPRAARERFGPVHGDRIKVAVTAPPVDGAANDAVVALLARVFECPRRDIEVVMGQSSRRKTVRIAGVSANDVQERLDG